MKIGDLSRATGIKVETIRFYEAEALIPRPARNAANYRVYDRRHLERLSFVKRSRDLGFTLDQIRDLLRLVDNPRAPCTDVDIIAARHVAEIDRKVADLQALRGELGRLLESCARSTIAECRIIEALSPGNTSG
ncbi:MAG: helix-turn-helix domain-containing protein [Sphingomonas bacterium]